MSSVLVLQHPHLPHCDLSALAAILPEHHHFLFDASVLRVPVSAGFALGIAAKNALLHQQIDFAVLPDVAFSSLGLIVSDMDSTFITIECVDEIAAGAGLKDKIAVITEQSMRGELDFAQSLRQRVALLAGLPESRLQYVYDHILSLTPGAEWLLAECRQHHVPFMLVSGGFTFFTQRLQQQYGLDYAYANQLVSQHGALTGELSGRLIDAQAKVDLLEQHRRQLHLTPDQVVAMGDGANDIPMIQAAGFGIAFHGKPKTQVAADVCVRFGGLDAVRKWFR